MVLATKLTPTGLKAKFYKKYKSNPKKLKSEKEDDFDKWVTHYSNYDKTLECYYNDWLLDYCLEK